MQVFVLQLEGKKQWSLYKPPIELPQDYSADLTEDVIGEPTHKILLEVIRYLDSLVAVFEILNRHNNI